ncbi:MAG: hypothetical protein JSW40_00345 [Candidatus Omnitrophota bacterium]|nr:MAG: hypothetical protein JSW40_00345 [Candidatus Omnitrophota bacterium]
MKRNLLLLVVIGALSIVQSGCAVLGVPFQVAGAAFNLLNEVFQLLEGLPMPPPGVF